MNRTMLTNIVYGNDIRMMQTSGCDRFLMKSFDKLLIIAELGRQQFDRHRTAQRHVIPTVDDAHTTAPYFSLHIVLST